MCAFRKSDDTPSKVGKQVEHGYEDALAGALISNSARHSCWLVDSNAEFDGEGLPLPVYVKTSSAMVLPSK